MCVSVQVPACRDDSTDAQQGKGAPGRKSLPMSMQKSTKSSTMRSRSNPKGGRQPSNSRPR